MADAVIIDALFAIPQRANVTQLSDCAPFSQDLTPLMNSSGITGAILAPCNCNHCQHQWNCADRRTDEIVNAVARNPTRLRGLASYDPLRIGDSLRWIWEASAKGGLAGAYAQSESCVSGLHAARMYPLYGLCAMLRSPVILDISSRDSWAQHRPQVEVVAADFPELEILLAPPPHPDTASILRLMQRFPRISFLLRPQDLQGDALLCEYIELQGRERALFRSSSKGWPPAVETALGLRLGAAARRAYLFENASRVYGFAV